MTPIQNRYFPGIISILAPIPRRANKLEVTKGRIEVVMYLTSAAVTVSVGTSPPIEGLESTPSHLALGL